LYGECIELAFDRMRATISPGLGLSLVAFTIDGTPILDPSRQQAFLDIRKGLGPLIGPHFGEGAFRPAIDPAAFPHVSGLRAMGIADPFQHGVGRYCAWTFEADGQTVRGRIDGKTRLAGMPLAELEGFDFQAAVSYALDAQGLRIAFDLAGEKPVAAGIHFYYDLVERKTASVELPVEEAAAGGPSLRLDFRQGHNTVFHPRLATELCTYRLTTTRYVLDTTVRVLGEAARTFDSVILFSPAGERFACVEPISYRRDGDNPKRVFRGEILLAPQAR
jgi:hypothetical protein